MFKLTGDKIYASVKAVNTICTFFKTPRYNIKLYWLLEHAGTQYYFVILDKPVNIEVSPVTSRVCHTVTFYQTPSGDFYIGGAWQNVLSENELAQMLFNTIDLVCVSDFTLYGSTRPVNYEEILAFFLQRDKTKAIVVSQQKQPRFYYWLYIHILKKVKSLLRS